MVSLLAVTCLSFDFKSEVNGHKHEHLGSCQSSGTKHWIYAYCFSSPHRDRMSQKKMGEHLQMKMRGHYLEKRKNGRRMKI